MPGAIAATRELFKGVRNRPDAIFCANDLTAIGAIEALKQLGLRVPEEQERDNDEGRHEVVLSQPFLLGQFAVTQVEYERVIRRQRSHFTRRRAGSVVSESVVTGSPKRQQRVSPVSRT